jgi:putative Flp pilus-assembly TadE/G-like protein
LSTNTPSGRGQRGQMMLVTAIAMVVLIGFTAMAIDVGLAYRDRRDLQNDVDAAALAGSQHLPSDPSTAKLRANDWLTKNGIKPAQITSIDVESGLAANDTIRVEVDDNFGWIFGRVLGLTTSNVGAHGKARVGSVGGNNEIMPWAILQGDSACLDGNGDAIWGQDCSVKVGAGSSISGWYGALDYDGNGGGSSEYEGNIIDGMTDTIYCAEGSFSDPCPGTTLVADLDGNKVGGTGQGIETRLATGPACDGDGNGTDDFDEVFQPDPAGINDYVVVCPDSPRAIIIPIVSISGTPVQNVTIEGWTLAYLESYSCVSVSATPLSGGNMVLAVGENGPAVPFDYTPASAPNCNTAQGHWEVQIKIVNASYSQVEGYLGAYDPSSGITVRRLIE